MSDTSRPPLLLALESATGAASVALLQGSKVLAEASSSDPRNPTEHVLPLVDRVLGEAAKELDEIEAFALSIGPGSFTSLRVGLSTIKGLAFGTDRPAVPISTLEAVAWGARRGRSSGALLALLDARRGELYAAGYELRSEAGDELLEERVPEGVYAPDELVAALEAAALNPVLVGPGAAIFAEGMSAEGTRHWEIDQAAQGPPRARFVGELALRVLANGEGQRVADLLPRYLRRAEAEVIREARSARE